MTHEPPARPPNRLASEASPYLQQHAYNPVDWHPWGEEALRKAKDLDRPIFLSIGYSACHWCHVMERESFEDEEIARALNEDFVSIKVDREERPDLDAIYMASVQQLTGSGGWPMSVFLTPELKPFYGGTYFPPRGRFGRPGFLELLKEIARVFRERRREVEENAATLTRYLAEGERIEGEKGLPGDEVLAAAVAAAKRTFDRTHGGFGPAPKFPRSIDLSALLRHWDRARDHEVLAMCEQTLEAMARGGMYDQIGGGFHRYSTDERWLIPHFEKMLYDNALLARTYVEAFQATGKDFHSRIAAEVLDYVLREMTSPEGGFYSSTDADSEGEEGKFFVWTTEEVEAALGKDDARVACEHWNITVGGNFEGGASVPHVTRSVEMVARSLRLEPEDVTRRLERARGILRAQREKREKPFRDEKVLTAWNGLMISALVRVHAVLGDPRHLEAARRAAAFILRALSPGGRLHRVYKDGRVAVPGYLDDHAFFAESLLDLYEVTFEVEYLRRARGIMDALIDGFADAAEGGFFFTAAGQEGLIVRKKDLLDNATPSGSGVAALNLLRLERLTGVARYRTLAEDLFKSLKPVLERLAMAFGSTIMALDFHLHPPVEIAFAGDPGDPRMKELLAAVHRRFIPAKVLAGTPPGGSVAEVASEVPLLAGKVALDGLPAAYVCRDLACRPPVTSRAALEDALEDAARS